jgi:hypothetical protein
MERKYMMYEGEDVNTIDLLHEVPTTEGNGVKIIIPVRYQDAYQFRKKIKEQLCYFESVYFDVPDDNSITNDFVISRHTHFQFSEMSTDDKLHICLDNVYYPLDFEKVGIDRIDFPVALRFSLSDGLYPTPNRESLRYTQEAKQIILSKLSNVADYFVNKYNEQLGEGNNIASVINHLEKNGHRLMMPNGTPRTIDDFMEYSKIQIAVPELDGINLIDFPALYKKHKQEMINYAFPSKFLLRYKRMQDTDKHYVYGYTIESICTGGCKVWVFDDRVPGIKKDYLRATCKESDYNFIVKRAAPMKLGIPAKFDNKTYYHLLELANYPKNQWRDVIKEYQHIISLIEAQFTDLDELVVPQHFIDSKKKAKVISTGISNKRLKIQGEIVCKKAVDLMRYNDGRNCKFDSQLYKLEHLESAKHLKVYTHHDDYLKLDALYGIMGKQKMEVITFSARELKIVEQLDIHNLISYDKFMEGKTAPFKRIVTATLIDNLMSKYRYVFEKSQMFKHTSTDFYKKLEALADYKRANYVCANSDLNKAMLVVAEEHKLFDHNIYPEYLQMIDILNKLTFIYPLSRTMGYFNADDPMVGVVTDLFKYYKHRVDFKHYNIKINDEVLTEETIEDLVD